MSDRPVNCWQEERGSLPLTLLVVIIVAGLASVLVARVVVGERTVRFDNVFSREIHTADAGIAEALFHISEDVGGISATAIGGSLSLSAQVEDQEYDVEVLREGQRVWRITSVARPTGATPGDGPERTVVAEIIEEPLFFPGAFGDDIVALEGTSTLVDSYHSMDPDPYTGVPCSTTAADCAWGTDAMFGTGNGTIGTNGVLEMDGNVDIRPGSAFLYDWDANPGSGITSTEPFGDRCVGIQRCTAEYVSVVLEALEYDTPEKMGFIDDKFASGGGCETVSSNPRYAIPGGTISADVTSVGKKNTTLSWTAYAPGTGNDDVTDDGFTNYYCAENLEILSHIRLDASVTPEDPVVIFVKDGFRVPEPHTKIACHDHTSATWCDSGNHRNVRPVSSRLQVFMAGMPATLSSSNATLKSQTMVAGVFYAPRSRCGGVEGDNAGADVYGIMLCSSMQNVGNWAFHFDDALGRRGAAQFSIGSWNEE